MHLFHKTPIRVKDMAALVCSGDLYKLGGGALSRLQKRYFELRDNGALTYFEKPQGEEKGVIYVEGAKVVDRGTFQGKACFSIEGVNLAKGVKEYFLYADDAATKWMWYQGIQKYTKRYDFYAADDNEDSSCSAAGSSSPTTMDPRILRAPAYSTCIEGNAHNQVCADCGSLNPTWAINKPHGGFVCIECIGVHRNLWSGLCKEIELDRWSSEEIEYFASRGNKTLNDELEFHVPSTYQKPNRWSTRQVREKYICAKYQDKLFSIAANDGEQPLAPVFDTACKTDHTKATLQAFGAPPKYIGVAFFMLTESEGYSYNGCVAVITNGFQEIRGKPGSKVDSSTTRWNEMMQIGVDILRRPLYVTLYEGDNKIAATAEVILADILSADDYERPAPVSVPLTGKSIGENTKAFLHGTMTFSKLT